GRSGPAAMVTLLAQAQETGAIAHAVGSGAAGLTRYAWILPVILVCSSFLTLFIGKKIPGKGPVFGIAAVGVGLILSLGILWHFVQGGSAFASSVAWFHVG